MYLIDINSTKNDGKMRECARRYLESIGFHKKDTNIYCRKHPMLQFELREMQDRVLSLLSSPTAPSLDFEYEKEKDPEIDPAMKYLAPICDSVIELRECK